VANDSLDFVQRGKVSIVRRQYAEAVKICRLGLLGQPSLLEGRLVLGMALTALGRWDEVLAEMRVALETDPNAALAWLLKGEALVGKGDYSQAEAALKRAKELDPSNTKADQLLAEIESARAAGFEGLPAEPTDTKVYPAKATVDTDPALGQIIKPMPGGGGERVIVEPSEDLSVEYEESTRVDPDPSRVAPVPAPPSVLVEFAGEDTVEDSQIHTVPARGQPGAGLAPRPQQQPPAVAVHGALDDRPEDSRMTPAERLRNPGPVGRLRAVDGLPQSREVSGSISLTSSDIIVTASAEGIEDPSNRYAGLQPAFGEDDDDEDDETRQRRQSQLQSNAGTTPEASEPIVNGQRPGTRTGSRPKQAADEFPLSPSEMPTAVSRDSSPQNGYGYADAPLAENTPGVVRVPVRRPPPPRTTALVPSTPWGDGQRRGVALLLTALVAVVAVGVATGLVVREWRMRARVAKRHELARQKIVSGNYPGFQAAELLYRQILAERDDPLARASRARVLALMSFEFGDSPDGAQRATTALGPTDASPCTDGKPGCQEAAQARVYLAMARGELDLAARLARALRRKVPDASSNYLVGRSELLLEHPDSAAEALRAAAEAEPHNPTVLHGLGLAEAAAHHEDRAFDAYRQALTANANHIATIVDRALLQVQLNIDRDGARGALSGVVSKLVADSSPGQLARAYLGLAELELVKGDLPAARRDLSQAASQHRDGDALFSEQLAQAFADAYDLDAAEREARRAIAIAGRLTPRLVLAQLALKRAHPLQALAVIEDAGTSRPEALVMRALASLELGRKEAARMDAESALRVQPDLVSAKVALALVDIAEGKTDKAQRSLDAIERSATKVSEVAAALGQVYVAGKAPDRARYWLKEALKRDPFNLEARLGLSRLLHDLGQLDAARDQLRQLLQVNASYAPARRELAMLALDAGDASAARDELDTLLAPCPADKPGCDDSFIDLDLLMNAARAHLLVGDGVGAQERIVRAQRLPPTATSAEELAGLSARALMVEHKPADAVALLTKIVPTAQRGETTALLMEAYLDLEQPDRALDAVKLAPPKARTGVELLVARARLQIERNRDVAAEGLAQEALLRLRGPHAPRALKAEAYLVLGRAQYDQGSFKPAMRSLRTATELDPHSARAFYYLALVLESVQQMPEARNAMESAVKDDPGFADALYNLGRMRALFSDGSAADAFQKYLEVAPKGVYAAEARAALAHPNTAAATPTSSPPQMRRRGR
jgi:tetratricopeptide (TPR) repeat protein